MPKWVGFATRTFDFLRLVPIVIFVVLIISLLCFFIVLIRIVIRIVIRLWTSLPPP